MRRLSVVLLCICVCACAEVETIDPPKAPQLVGAIPAVGRSLDLAVEGRGTPVRLRGVTGRVTAVCVLGTAGTDARGAEAGSATPRAQGAGTEADTGAEADAGTAGEPAAEGDPEAQADPVAEGESEADSETATAPAPAAPPEEVPIPPAERQAPLLAATAERVLRACTEVGASLADRIAVVALTTDPDLDLDRMEMRTFRDPEGKALGDWLDLPPASQVLLVDQQGRVADVLPPDELHRLEPAALRLVH